jgi:hypothetical protein
MNSSLIKLLKSEKLWNHMSLVCKVFAPAIYLLRIADKSSPAMDKLYYYVRKMDEAMTVLTDKMDEIEERINVEGGQDIRTKMIRYYLSSGGRLDSGRAEINSVCEELNKKDNNENEMSDDEEDDDDEEPLPDDQSESDDDESVVDYLDNRESARIMKSWEKRSKKLRHDMAIAGWMCSPIEEIMEDAKENHDGEHRNATTRVLKIWMGSKNQVSLQNNTVMKNKLHLTQYLFCNFLNR